MDVCIYHNTISVLFIYTRIHTYIPVSKDKCDLPNELIFYTRNFGDGLKQYIYMNIIICNL